MPVVARPDPRSSVVAVAVGLAVVLSLGAPPAPVRADAPRTPPRPPGLGAFMEALGSVESGGRYDARNPTSGAYGRYQILPSNWPAWARIYLGDRRAKPTPANQDRVASGRLSDLHRAYDRWDRVAYWWLTGRKGPRPGWSDYATRYVVRVMTRFRTRLASPAPGAERRILGDRSQAIRWTGGWISAHHRAYTGDHAHASKRRGATMIVRFTGRSVQLLGPVGPTRGRAAVFIDGRHVRTIDLRAATFHPRRVVFQASWRRTGTHRVVLRVLGTKGRPTVAIDRVVVGG